MGGQVNIFRCLNILETSLSMWYSKTIFLIISGNSETNIFEFLEWHAQMVNVA